MSLLWRDKLLIGFSPERVALLRRSGGWRAALRAKALVPVARGGDPAWQGAVEALAATVRGDAAWRAADAQITLSNHFARYQLLPWSDAIGNDAERDRYARELFLQVYGDVVGQWDIRVTETGYGAPWLACAVDRGLVEALGEALGAGNNRLVSLTPHLVSAFNGTRPAFKEKDTWLVQVEPGRLLLALFVEGRWRVLNSRQIVADAWAHELPRLLDREARLNGLNAAPRNVYLSAPEVNQAALDGAGRWVYRWLRPKLGFGLAGKDDAPYAMALGA